MTASSATTVPPSPIAGYVGFALGALSLLLVLTQFWAGPFAPQQRTGVTVGELAAEIRQAAVRKLKGQPPPKPAARPWDIDRVLEVSAALLAGLALIAGAFGYTRREDWRPAAAGVTLGASAVAFQFFVWAILVIACAIIVAAVVHNIGNIFPS